eukprot:4546580-Pyramimonas_sp.AAC.1
MDAAVPRRASGRNPLTRRVFRVWATTVRPQGWVRNAAVHPDSGRMLCCHVTKSDQGLVDCGPIRLLPHLPVG